MKRKDIVVRWGALAIAAIAALVAFYGMFGRLHSVFVDAHEDMMYGFMVPLFSLYVLWKERDRILASISRPSWLGFAMVLPCLPLLVFGSRGLQVRVEAVAFIGLCVAVPWALLGRRVALLCLFPAAYLAFCIPVSTFLDFVTIHLRLLASGLAVDALNLAGFEVARQGTAILSHQNGGFAIDVAEPCSGLRSLFAVMAFSAAYGWVVHRTWLRRGLLFALSIPLAVIGNVLRIMTICLISAFGAQDFALGFYHDYSPWFLYGVEFALLFAVADAINRIGDRFAKKGESASPVGGETAARREMGVNGVVICGLTAVAMVALAVFQVSAPVPTLTEPPAAKLPPTVEGYSSDTISFCQNDQCGIAIYGSELGKDTKCPRCGGELSDISLGEKTILPADTRLVKRVYVDDNGSRFIACMVFGGASKSSIHRPELCLPAQGFIMSDPRNFTVAGRPYHAITLKGVEDAMLVYTFFNQEGFVTASHTSRILRDMFDRSVLNRIDRWVMLTVDAEPGAGVSIDELQADLQKFLERIGSL